MLCLMAYSTSRHPADVFDECFRFSAENNGAAIQVHTQGVEQVYRPSSDKAAWCKELAHRIQMKANMERQRHIDMAKEYGKDLRRSNHAAFVRHMSKGMKS